MSWFLKEKIFWKTFKKRRGFEENNFYPVLTNRSNEFKTQIFQLKLSVGWEKEISNVNNRSNQNFLNENFVKAEFNVKRGQEL